MDDIDLDINCYDILEISKSATDKEIAKAYRKLTKKMHPDVTGQPPTEEFIQIQKAYNILKDPDKQQRYNSYMNNEFIIDETPDFDNVFDNVFDIDKKEENYEPINIILDVTLEDIYNKKTKLIKISKKTPCNKCKGEKIDVEKLHVLSCSGNNFRCAECKGLGHIIMIQMSNHSKIEIPMPCPQCKGRKVLMRPEIMCDNCIGLGFKNITDIVEIKLTSGITHGEKLQIDRIGHQMTILDDPSPVIIYINELNNDLFKRSKDGFDLLFICKIPLFDALGCNNRNRNRFINIKTLSEKEMVINLPNGKIIKPGEVKKIVGEGMPISNNEDISNGDLYILFEIIFPDTLSSDEFSGLTDNGLKLSTIEMEKISYSEGIVVPYETDYILDYDEMEDINMSHIHPNFAQKEKIIIGKQKTENVLPHTQCPVM